MSTRKPTRKSTRSYRKRHVRTPADGDVLDRLPLTVVVTGTDGTITKWNSFAERTYGWTADEVLEKNLPELLVPPASREKYQELVKGLGESETCSAEFAAQRQDGTRVFVSMSVTAVRGTGGNLTALLHVSQEIAADKKAEEAQRESNERLELYVENVKDYAFIILDLEGRVTGWNTGAERITGYGENEILGEHFSRFYDAQDKQADRPQQMMQLALETGRCENEGWHVRKDGTQFWADVVITPLRDRQGAVRGFAKVTRDISERKQAMEAESAHRARAEALVRTAERLNAQLDLEGVLRTVCEQVAQSLHVPAVTITLFDRQKDSFLTAATFGLPTLFRETFKPMTREVYERSKQESGNVILVRDLRALPDQENADLYRGLDLQSAVTVTMQRGGEPVGSLTLFNAGAVRDFATEELSLFEGLANQAAQAVTNARLYEEAQRRLDYVQALRAIDLAITGSLDLRLTFNAILEQISRQLDVDAACILVLDEYSHRLEYGAGRGFRGNSHQQAPAPLGESFAGKAVIERRIVSVANLNLEPEGTARAQVAANEGFVTFYAIPLIAKGHVKGVLELFHRSMLVSTSEWIDFMQGLAVQTAIAIDNAELFSGLQKSNFELAMAYESTIEGWSRALDLRDRETEGHTQRVTEVTLRLARAVGMPGKDLVHLRHGALLHDIGKMGIPDAILLKPGPLDEEEWQIMRLHPELAHKLLMPIQYLRPALDIPYCHHEHWDGKGYPRGLGGAEIPLSARIFAVVDVWDALMSDRPYRSAWSRDRVLEYIRERAGAQFDPEIVRLFLEMQEES